MAFEFVSTTVEMGCDSEAKTALSLAIGDTLRMLPAPRDQAAYEKFDESVETPMLVLSLVLIPMLLIPALVDVSSGTSTFLAVVGWIVWVLFALEVAVLWWLAPDRRDMLRTHKLDVLLVVVPFLRPLRVLRAARLVPAAIGGFAILRRLLEKRGLGWMILAVAGVILLGGGLAARFERGVPGATIDSFGDGVWWALVTCTTVGYGDVSPISTGGRLVATVLMLVGVSLLGVLTANIAAVFVAQDTDSEIDELRVELAEVNAKLDRLLEAR